MHRVVTIAAEHARAAGFEVLPLVDGFEARAADVRMRVATRGLRIDVSFMPRGHAPLRCQIEGRDAVRAFVNGIGRLWDGESFAGDLVGRLGRFAFGADRGARERRPPTEARPEPRPAPRTS
jgi:hypothetical protein